jgi:hypothetical protein
MLPPARKECQGRCFCAGFTLTQFRHSYIQIPQWRPVRLISIPQLVDNRRAFCLSRVVLYSPAGSGFLANDPGSGPWHKSKRLTHWKRPHIANIRIDQSGASIVTRTLFGQPASRFSFTTRGSKTNPSVVNPASRQKTNGSRQLRQHSHRECGKELKSQCSARNADNKLRFPFIRLRDARSIVAPASWQERPQRPIRHRCKPSILQRFRGSWKRDRPRLKTNQPPTWTIGRLLGSFSALRKTSCVTGAVSPSPNAMYFNRYEIGLPSLHPKYTCGSLPISSRK